MGTGGFLFDVYLAFATFAAVERFQVLFLNWTQSVRQWTFVRVVQDWAWDACVTVEL